jgi:hypothetical protein
MVEDILERTFRTLGIINDTGFISLKLERFYSSGDCLVLGGLEFNIKIPKDKIHSLSITRRAVSFEYGNTKYVLI